MFAMSRLTRATLTLLGTLGLALSVACGGGGGGGGTTPTPVATSLSYTDPTGVAATEYKLVKNNTSTSTHLILDLMGPATPTTGNGASFELTTDTTKTTWVKVAAPDAELIHEGTTFALGTAPKLIKAKLSAANATLTAGLFQKGTGAPAAVDGTKALAQVSLDLKAGIAPGDVALSVVGAKCFLSDASGNPAAITVKVGTLKAQ